MSSTTEPAHGPRRVRFPTPLGTGWVVSVAGDVCAITLPGASPPEGSDDPDPAPAAARLVEALVAYYSGQASLLGSPGLVARAARTELRRRIYDVVCRIPPGSTLTYAEVAAAAGRPGAARAVGAAMAANPFPPFIPCHRVVGSDGTLRGYAGGLDMKAALLAMEAGARPGVTA